MRGLQGDRRQEVHVALSAGHGCREAGTEGDRSGAEGRPGLRGGHAAEDHGLRAARHMGALTQGRLSVEVVDARHQGWPGGGRHTGPICERMLGGQLMTRDIDGLSLSELEATTHPRGG